MHFLIVPMRVRGVPRSQKEIRKTKPIQGDVHLHLDNLAPLGRASNSASILNVHPGKPALPPLYEAVMTGMSTMGATFTGIEFIDGVAYAQSWWVRVP
ncbi:hypothetical protein MF6396_16860 [Pseudomonas sp. MF6396]|uniref:hypothetical protein n=1 Tax=Pseudomonas sp. MF6396 TaxID=1960828 RepID=UPI0009980E7D|nr:hypothetical protein [Pseudomonas sp. MF6396]OOW00006.1 hypothetical protein MF6396_16860 [Pseudomonas sp. MF6396]